MFLFFMILISLCVGFYNLLKDWKSDKDSKERAIKNGKSWYVDRYNNYVDVNTDVPYRYDSHLEFNGEGYRKTDMVKRHAYSGKVIQNLTQDVRDKAKAEREVAKRNAIAAGEDYYVYDIPRYYPGEGSKVYDFMVGWLKHGVTPLSNIMWADVNTDERFFCKKIYCYKDGESVYANIMWSLDSGRIERIVDEEFYTEEELSLLRQYIDKENKRHEDISWSIFKEWDLFFRYDPTPKSVHCEYIEERRNGNE